MMISRQNDERLARDIAKDYSKESMSYCCVIKSRGIYFVDTSSFCRTTEELIIEYDKGKEIRRSYGRI